MLTLLVWPVAQRKLRYNGTATRSAAVPPHRAGGISLS